MWRSIIMFIVAFLALFLGAADGGVLNVAIATVILLAVGGLTACWAVPKDIADIRQRMAREKALERR